MSVVAPAALPVPTILVELQPDTLSVQVVVGVPAGARLLDVWRVGPSGTLAYVRATEARAVTGPTTAYAHDFEAPFGVPLVYTARVALADGSNASQASAPPFTVTPPSEDPWLTDILRPSNTQSVIVEKFDPLAYEAPTGVHRVLGRRGPIVTSDAAWTPSGEFVFVTTSDDSAERARDTLGTGVPVLLQTLPEQGVGNVYLSVLSWTVARVSRIALYPDRRFTVQVVQVERPDPRLFAPVGPATYASVNEDFDSYADVKASVPDYDALLFNWTASGEPPALAVPWPPTDV